MKTIKILLISTLFIMCALFINNVYAQDKNVNGIGSDNHFDSQMSNHRPEQDKIEYFYDIQTGDIYDKNNKIIGKVIFQIEDQLKEGKQFMFKTVNGGYYRGSACVIDKCETPKWEPYESKLGELDGKKVKY
jgi:hypothetical protein